MLARLLRIRLLYHTAISDCAAASDFLYLRFHFFTYILSQNHGIVNLFQNPITIFLFRLTKPGQFGIIYS